MTRLATFLHISDLHIGEFEDVSGDSKISWSAVNVLGNMPLYDGLLGHHGAALRHLHDFADRLRDQEDDCFLVATGDLSRWGDFNELRSAQGFLQSAVNISPSYHEMVGLHFNDDAYLIPGNHDHWAGVAPPLGATPSVYPHAFVAHPTPSAGQPRLLQDGKTNIRFIHIDSDADIAPNSINRLLARGDFVSQLNIQPPLPARPKNEIRVLLIHHSRSHAGTVLAMTKASKIALDQFLATHQIRVMLTGHTHQPIARLHTISHSASTHELGAGGTTQVDVLPYKWKRMLRRPSRLGTHPNTLMVHRIYQRHDELWWETQIYQRYPGGFKRVSDYSFKI